MKKILFGLLLLVVAQPAFSAEKCTIEIKLSVYRPDGNIFNSTRDPDYRNTLLYKTKTWQDCYKHAIIFSQVVDNSSRVALSSPLSQSQLGSMFGMSPYYTAAARYVKWTFNDAYLFDTEGAVSVFTNQFLKPAIGDNRVNSYGESFTEFPKF